MKYINTNIYTIRVATTLLYRSGGINMDIKLVEYDYFHLLVTLNTEIPDVRCGVVVIKTGDEQTQEFHNYLKELGNGIFEKDSPDNMPILLMIINEKEDGYIKMLLGMNNRFEQTIYPEIEKAVLLNKESYSSLEPIIKSMNKTITVLSLSSVCVLRTIPFHNINERMRFSSGVFLYARKNTIDYQIRPIKYENELDNYLLNPSFEKDELDNYILYSLRKKYGTILELGDLDEKFIALSTDICDMQLYDNQHGYLKIPYIINFMPEVKDYPDVIDLLGLGGEINSPSINISIYVQGNKDEFEGNNYDEVLIPLNQYISKCNEVSKLKESIVDIDNWINIQ